MILLIRIINKHKLNNTLSQCNDEYATKHIYTPLLLQIIQLSGVITLLKYSQWAPHSSPGKVRYGWCFVSSESAACSIIVCAVQCYLKLCFEDTLRPRPNGRHFAADIFTCILLNKNMWISLKMPLKLLPKFPINNIPALVQIMTWRRPGNKPLSEPMMVIWTTHIWISRHQWVKWLCRKACLRKPRWDTGQGFARYWLHKTEPCR